MANMVADGLAVCVDCTLVIANGVETEEQAEAARIMAERWQGIDLVLDCPEECEGYFSHTACDGCGSTLGGDRHPAVGFAR